jgi:hypothetical protein
LVDVSLEAAISKSSSESKSELTLTSLFSISVANVANFFILAVDMGWASVNTPLSSSIAIAIVSAVRSNFQIQNRRKLIIILTIGWLGNAFMLL